MHFARRASIVLLAMLPLASLEAAQRERLSPQAARALDLNNTAALRLAGLERELQQIQLAPVFTAAALTSPTRVAEGKATIVRLRKLTAQRGDVARAHAAEIASLRQQAPAALAGIDSYLTESQRVHDELHAARTDVADRADEVLAWASEQGSTIELEHKRIRMKSPEQKQRYDALFARLDAAMVRHDKAVDASEAFRKANQGRLNAMPIPAQGKPTR